MFREERLVCVTKSFEFDIFESETKRTVKWKA